MTLYLSTTVVIELLTRLRHVYLFARNRFQKHAGKNLRQQADFVQCGRDCLRVHGVGEYAVRRTQLHGIGVLRTQTHNRRERSKHDNHRCVNETSDDEN